MEISCLTRTGPGSKIVSVYMVYLQGMSHEFEINVINAFYIKFWNPFGKFFKRSCFFPFGILKNESFTFLICYLLVINIYCFFDLLLFQWSWYIWLLLRQYFWWIVQVSVIFEKLFSCFFVVPISHTRKFRKKTHTIMFFLKKPWAKLFLKQFVFAIQFWDKSWDFIFVNSPHLKIFVKLYYAKTNSVKIYIVLNIYCVKIYSFKVIQRS